MKNPIHANVDIVIVIIIIMIIHMINMMINQVKNPIHAVANVDDYSGSARLLAATTLR